MRDNIYLQLLAVFAPLSLLSLGGGQSIVADINQQAVAIHGWVTQAEFVDLFAISRAAPGPGALLTTLIGWKTSGFLGAVVASLALFVPSSVLAYGATIALDAGTTSTPGTGRRSVASLPWRPASFSRARFRCCASSSSTWMIWGLAAIALVIFLVRPKIEPARSCCLPPDC